MDGAESSGRAVRRERRRAVSGGLGLEVLERNWRCRDGELDIVAGASGLLVFCEVKTRTSVTFGQPVEAVKPAKAARIRRLAVRWLAERREEHDALAWAELRFDVISVLCSRQGAAQVEHFQAAF
jgi:putative endonuclease